MKIINKEVDGVNVTVRVSAEARIVSAVVNGVTLAVVIGAVDPAARAYVQFANTGVVNWIPVYRGGALANPTDVNAVVQNLYQSTDRWLSGVMTFAKTKVWPRDLVVGAHGSGAIPHGSMLWRFSEHGVCDDIRRVARVVTVAAAGLKNGVVEA